MNEPEHSAEVYLKRIAEDIKIIRQQMTEAHTDGGTFEKVRREMVKDENNRWDHTRAIGVSK